MADSAGCGNHGRENENGEQDGLSMLDVLEEERQLEDDADAVLGDSDDKNCTYESGYVARQALYACLTCTPPSRPPGGVCLACSYECHEGHDLVELYTKRFFRCDCGNSQFGEMKCKLNSDKEKVNGENKYNQNFKGLYCTCNRPYPDPEDDIEDEMIQCILCEDWHHGRHLGSDALPSTDFQEMICPGCMKNNSFLWYYCVKSLEIPLVKSEESGQEVDICRTSNGGPASSADNLPGTSSSANSEATSTTNQTESQKPNVCENKADSVASSSKTEDIKSNIENKPMENAVTEDRGKLREDLCKLKELMKREVKTSVSTATFWPDKWRQKLCLCPLCKQMYKESGIDFITEESDTVKAYEERGKARRAAGSQYEQGMQALSSMDRVQQVEVLHEYNDLKSELKDYLKKFAENGKVVREEDIKEFFTQMQARKRQRVAPSMTYNCR